MFSFKNKLILAFVFFGILLITISTVLIFKMQELSFKAMSIEKAEQTYQKLDKDIGLYRRNIETSLNALETSRIFQQYLADMLENKQSPNTRLVSDFFMSFVSAADNIYQYRFIDKQGMEVLRTEREYFSGPVIQVPEDKLQNKNSRYYFQEAIYSDKLITYSRIDLNIENGVIEKPIKSVFRIARKVFVDNQLVGILIVNVFMDEFISRLISSPVFDIFLVDKNGYFLAHPDKNKVWGHYLGFNYRAEDVFAEEAACILNNSECQSEQFYARNVHSLINPDGLKLIIQPKLYKFRKQMQTQFENMLYVSLAVLTLSFPIAWVFSITPTRLKNRMDQLNSELERKIEEKVNELKNSNKVLEHKVLDRTRELEEANTKLYKQATIDPLTEIPNRRYFFEMSDRYLQLSHRKRQAMSFIIFDIDYFKKVNDSYGHETGDQVLKAITATASQLLRRSDILGRIGGEEFAVALPDSNLDEALEIAEKLRVGIENDIYDDGSNSIQLTISLGVTQTMTNEQEVSAILSRADIALYQAKGDGRNKVCSN